MCQLCAVVSTSQRQRRCSQIKPKLGDGFGGNFILNFFHRRKVVFYDELRRRASSEEPRNARRGAKCRCSGPVERLTRRSGRANRARANKSHPPALERPFCLGEEEKWTKYGNQMLVLYYKLILSHDGNINTSRCTRARLSAVFIVYPRRCVKDQQRINDFERRQTSAWLRKGDDAATEKRCRPYCFALCRAAVRAIGASARRKARTFRRRSADERKGEYAECLPKLSSEDLERSLFFNKVRMSEPQGISGK